MALPSSFPQYSCARHLNGGQCSPKDPRLAGLATRKIAWKNGHDFAAGLDALQRVKPNVESSAWRVILSRIRSCLAPWAKQLLQLVDTSGASQGDDDAPPPPLLDDGCIIGLSEPSACPNPDGCWMKDGVRGFGLHPCMPLHPAAVAAANKRGCWCRSHPQKGYVTLGIYDDKKGRRLGIESAHRLVCTATWGRAPEEGMVVMHLCDNALCVCPAHLKWGSKAENHFTNGEDRPKWKARTLVRAQGGVRKNPGKTRGGGRWGRRSSPPFKELG